MRVLVTGRGDPVGEDAPCRRLPVDRPRAGLRRGRLGYRCAIGMGSTGSARSKPNTRP